VLGLTVALAAVVNVVYAIWDAVNDPLAGHLSDNTRASDYNHGLGMFGEFEGKKGRGTAGARRRVSNPKSSGETSVGLNEVGCTD